MILMQALKNVMMTVRANTLEILQQLVTKLLIGLKATASYLSMMTAILMGTNTWVNMVVSKSDLEKMAMNLQHLLLTPVETMIVIIVATKTQKEVSLLIWSIGL